MPGFRIQGPPSSSIQINLSLLHGPGEISEQISREYSSNSL